MKKLNSYSRAVPWFMASLLSALVAGCGGGSGNADQAPILGGNVATLTPAVTAVSPIPGATAVPINTKIVTAAFNKAMDPATLNASSLGLTCPGTTPIAGMVASYTTVGNVATLTLPAGTNLVPNSVCTATVTTAAKDTFGIALAKSFSWTFTTGLAPDTTPPTVTGTIHTNGAANVAVNTKVGATFSEAMDATTVTGTNFILKQGTTTVPGTVSYLGVSAVLTPNAALAFNTTYTVTVKGGVGGVADAAGNTMGSDFVISWTTGAAPDTTPPTVTGTINTNGATNVAINTKMGATFSEGMDPLTVTNANVTLKEAVSGLAVAGTVSYTGLSTVFTPLANLSNNTRYTATVKGSAAGVKDLAGNTMLSDYVWSWTTSAAIDSAPPTVTGTINANGASNVAVNTAIAATFSEGMNPLSVTNQNFTMKEAVSGNAVVGTVVYSGVTAEFKPLNVLTAGTRYTLTLKGATGGVMDLAGNAMTSDYVWGWTTAVSAIIDVTAPTVAGTIHANGATNVAVNTTVGATFSEAMGTSTITNANFNVKDTATGVVVPGTLSYAGVNAVFIPLNSLANSTNYTVTVKGGLNGVKDLAGNAMVSDFSINWTTGAAPDTLAPTVVLVNPADLSTNVAVTSAVNATFNEAMDPLTMSTANLSVAGVTGLVSYDAVSKIASFTPSSNLAPGTTYTATVSTGAKDLAGNALAVSKVWSFTTAAAVVIPPVISLGAASTYGTFGGSAGMTNMGILTVINGNTGTTATGTSSITGFHDNAGDIYTQTGSNAGLVNGLIYSCTHSTTGPTSAGVNAAACSQAGQALGAAQTAYLALAAMPPGANPGANLASKTLAPGVYTSPSGSFLIEGGNLTLDAQGDANAIFVFQMASTLTVGGPGAAAPQSIILAGGAQAKNVFWQVGSFATINAGGGGTMVGTIIAQAGVSFSTAGNVNIGTLNGRALSLGASVTLVNTIINLP